MVVSIGVYKLGLFSMDHCVAHPQNITPESILLPHSFYKHYHHKDNHQLPLAHAHRPFLFIETSQILSSEKKSEMYYPISQDGQVQEYNQLRKKILAEEAQKKEEQRQLRLEMRPPNLDGKRRNSPG
jgi:hypothetical protein